MDDQLPSYESATNRNPWIYIAEYLPVQDLCAAAVVCQTWHKTFTPWLWGNPASHFCAQDEMVYVALTRFMRILPCVRLSVRELTHTLRLPPAHAESYGGPHAEWLRDCLEYLPRLQCLLVDGLPFLDHASLLTLRHPSLRWRLSRAPHAYPVFGLRLFDAAACANVTSTGLAEALLRFPDLVSLDLSRTLATRDGVVLGNLKFLRNLRVLGLKGLRLGDRDISIIARSVGTGVRSLDVSNNDLTDISAQLLLQHCIKETIVQPHLSRNLLASVNTDHANGGAEILDTRDLVTQLCRKLTYGFVGNLAIEEARDVGITHLYITKNAITIEGVSALLRSRRLQVLDIGEFSTATASSLDIDLSDVSRLTPILCEFGSVRLRYLRINSRIVTEDASIDVDLSPTATIPEYSQKMPSSVRTGTRSRRNSTYFTQDRRDRLDCRQSSENRLHPGMLPHVHTLVLTKVPIVTKRKEVVDRIIQYIKDAAEEASIARQRAEHTYMVPPGRSRGIAEREYAHSLFSLERIVLEMAPQEAAPQKVSTSWRAYPTRSSTEDQDSEAFWEAASQDFSFFGDDEGRETQSACDVKPLLDVESLPAVKPVLDVEPLLDVVAEIGKFRVERRAAYMQSQQLGAVEGEVEGWWPGDITVVRKQETAAWTDRMYAHS